MITHQRRASLPSSLTSSEEERSGFLVARRYSTRSGRHDCRPHPQQRAGSRERPERHRSSETSSHMVYLPTQAWCPPILSRLSPTHHACPCPVCVVSNHPNYDGAGDLCQTIVVSGGDFPGVYEFYTYDTNGYGAWSTADESLGLYFVPQDRRRRLSEDGDHGELLRVDACDMPRSCLLVWITLRSCLPAHLRLPGAWRQGRHLAESIMRPCSIPCGARGAGLPRRYWWL